MNEVKVRRGWGEKFSQNQVQGGHLYQNEPRAKGSNKLDHVCICNHRPCVKVQGTLTSRPLWRSIDHVCKVKPMDIKLTSPPSVAGALSGLWPVAESVGPVGADRSVGVAGGRWPVTGGRWPVAGRGRWAWPVTRGRWPAWPVAVTGRGRWPVTGGRGRWPAWPVAGAGGRRQKMTIVWSRGSYITSYCIHKIQSPSATFKENHWLSHPEGMKI